MERPPNARKPACVGLGHAAWLLALVAALPAVAAAQFGQRGNDGTRSTFSVPETEEVRNALEDAQKLFQRGRAADALEKIRPFVDDSAGRLLRVEVRLDGSVVPEREGRTWYGAWRLVASLVEAQPADVRAEVEMVDGPRASGMLERALATFDRAALRRTHQLFPWTRAGGDALVALASLSAEEGRVEEALAILHRALRRPDRAHDPDLHARVSLLARSLGRTAPEIPSGLAGESAVAVGGSTMTLAAARATEPPRLSKSPPSAAFSLANVESTADPGRVRGGARWAKELELEPVSLQDRTRPIYPVIAGDSVFVSNGWTLAAFDLAAGTPLWNAPASAVGWDAVASGRRQDYVTGEDRSYAYAPAVAGNVVVAPLLVPLKTHNDRDFNQITIYKVIPYRKLHAFDARTGAPMWSHWRPSAIEDRSDFLDDYRCAGPPVVAGDRVIAPVYRIPDGASTDFQIAAFDLRTGALQWSTRVATGQGPINMFNRRLYEFYSGPPAVDGDRVYFSSDLGVAGCIDLTSGLIQWLWRYDAMELPNSRSYFDENRRRIFWAASPPALSEQCVALAPTDSRYLYVLDRETGQPWLRDPIDANDPDPAPGTSFTAVCHVLGIVGRRLYLAGGCVVALDLPRVPGAPATLQAVSPRTTWVQWRAGSNEPCPPRPALTESSVLVPQENAIQVLDRENLSLAAEIPYQPGIPVQRTRLDRYYGNLVTSNGVILSLANPRLWAFFDADAIVSSARRNVAASPHDRPVVEKLARALQMRGQVRIRDREILQGLEDFREAEQVLQAMPGTEDLRARIALEAGGALEIRGNADQAAEAFARAFENARDAQVRRDAGLALERILPAAEKKERARVMEQLEREFGTVRIDTSALRREWGQVPLSLYLCLRRAEVAEDARDPVAAVAAWQESIQRFRGQWLGSGAPSPLEGYAQARIAELIRTHGRTVYAVIEQEARKRLTEAGEDATPEQLREISQLFPNSEAAATAACTSLERLVSLGRGAEVPPQAFQFLRTGPGDVPRRRALRASAAALESLGNSLLAERMLLESGVVRSERLANRAPEAVAGPSGSVGPASSGGKLQLLGLVRPAVQDTSAGEFAFGWDENRIYALRTIDTTPIDAAWSVSTDGTGNAAGRGAVLAAASGAGVSVWNGVLAYTDGASLLGARIADGSQVFRRPIGVGREVESAIAAQGLLIVVAGGSDGVQVRAVDAVAGTEVWESYLDRAGSPWLAVASETEVAFLPCGDTIPRVAIRARLATGEAMPTLTLPADFDVHAARRTRLYENRLVYSDYPLTRTIALDLSQGGRETWRVSADPSDGRSRLGAVLYGPDRVYAVRLHVTPDRREEGQLLSVDPTSGRTTLVTRMTGGTRLAGVGWDDAIPWYDPMLLLLSSEGEFTRVDAIELAKGRAWTQSLRATLDRPDIPAPAVGRDLLALAYVSRQKNVQLYEIQIFDRSTGRLTESRTFGIPRTPGSAFALLPTPGAFVVAAGKPGRDTRIHRFLPRDKVR